MNACRVNDLFNSRSIKIKREKKNNNKMQLSSPKSFLSFCLDGVVVGQFERLNKDVGRVSQLIIGGHLGIFGMRGRSEK